MQIYICVYTCIGHNMLGKANKQYWPEGTHSQINMSIYQVEVISISKENNHLEKCSAYLSYFLCVFYYFELYISVERD